jgi:Metallo-beta-lactamase superfamily
MALEIKLLDYGDVELEASFLVLGRDCGRTRRAQVFGMLILGGTWPILVDTGYRSNRIMETLGMRGHQSHETMIENQLKRHGLRLGDVRYVLHTHLHIDHAGKDDLFPMNTTVLINRRELEYSVSGLMHPQYPATCAAAVRGILSRLNRPWIADHERAAAPLLSCRRSAVPSARCFSLSQNGRGFVFSSSSLKPPAVPGRPTGGHG